MSLNSFGHLLKVTSWGESHGPAIGCVVDGVPPGIDLSETDIQPYLDQRRPGQSRYTTQRQEADQISIKSGVFEGKTTGTALALMIENTDQRSRDYGDIADRYRPGHADYTYDAKYGFRDYRGGGRSSARETAMRVAAGAIARKVLPGDIKLMAGLVQMGPHKADPARFDFDACSDNPFFCPDETVVENWGKALDAARKDGNSMGGLVEVRASGVPAGLGAPIYGKLDTDLAAALMSINAVKGVEIGDGMAVAGYLGTDNADEMVPGPDRKPNFLSNHAGGILGGISSGQDIVARLAIKPTSSILTPKRSVTRGGDAVEVITKGRHDPCVAIRGVPVAEAMLALVLADHWLLHRAQTGQSL